MNVPFSRTRVKIFLCLCLSNLFLNWLAFLCFRSALLAKEKGDITQALSQLHELIEAVQKETSEDISPDFNCRYCYHNKDRIPRSRQNNVFFFIYHPQLALTSFTACKWQGYLH